MSKAKIIDVHLVDADGNDFPVRRLRGREEISKPYEFDVEAGVPTSLDSSTLVGAHVDIVFTADGEDVRRIPCIVAELEDTYDETRNLFDLRFRLVPRIFRLGLRDTCDVYVDTALDDIVRNLFGMIDMHEGDDFQLHFSVKYPKREFVVQYKETDLAFLSRSLEHMGVSYYFGERERRDVITFTDDNTGFANAITPAELPYSGSGAQVGVYELSSKTSVIPNHFVVRDYNYRTPTVDLLGEATLPVGFPRDVVEYGTHFKTPSEGKYMAQIRAQERLAQRKIYKGKSGIPELRAGAFYVLDGHPFVTTPLLVTAVEHEFEQASGGAQSTASYRNVFHAIDKETVFRPARATPKPKVHGVITGTIDAATTGDTADLDDQGRYAVRFVFDTSDSASGQASHRIRMVQSHAGSGYGMHFPLRPGVEVVLTCVDGDPDRPIIAGTVPNTQTPSPVTSGNAKRNVIRTGGGNEMNIDDTSGKERIKLTTPHMNTSFQLGAPNDAETGAMLNTLGASTTVAQIGIGNVSAITADINLMKAVRNAGDVSTVAEKPSKAAKTMAVLGTLDGLASFVSGVLSLAVAGRQLQTAADQQTAAKDADQVTKDQSNVAAKKATLDKDVAAYTATLPLSTQNTPPTFTQGYVTLTVTGDAKQAATNAITLATSAAPAPYGLAPPASSIGKWTKATDYAAGATVQPTSANNFTYVVKTAGKSGDREPTWPATVGATVGDGTVVWVCAATLFFAAGDLIFSDGGGHRYVNTGGGTLSLHDPTQNTLVVQVQAELAGSDYDVGSVTTVVASADANEAIAKALMATSPNPGDGYTTVSSSSWISQGGSGDPVIAAYAAYSTARAAYLSALSTRDTDKDAFFQAYRQNVDVSNAAGVTSPLAADPYATKTTYESSGYASGAKGSLDGAQYAAALTFIADDTTVNNAKAAIDGTEPPAFDVSSQLRKAIAKAKPANASAMLQHLSDDAGDPNATPAAPGVFPSYVTDLNTASASRKTANDDAYNLQNDPDWERVAETQAAMTMEKTAFSLFSIIYEIYTLVKTTQDRFTAATQWASLGNAVKEAKPHAFTDASAVYNSLQGMSSPLNTLGSESATAIYAEKQMLVWAPVIGIHAASKAGIEAEEQALDAAARTAETQYTDAKARRKSTPAAVTKAEVKTLKKAAKEARAAADAAKALHTLMDANVDKGIVSIAGDSHLTLTSRNSIEIASGNEIWMTTQQQLNVNVKKDDGTFAVVSGGRASIESDKASVDLTAGTEINLWAMDALMQGDTTATVASGSWNLKLADASGVKLGSDSPTGFPLITVESDGIVAKSGATTNITLDATDITGAATNVKITGTAEVKLTGGASVTLGGNGPVNLDGAEVKIAGKAMVEIDGGMIKLG